MKLCFKKGLALVMAVLMVMSAFSTIAFAADDNIIDVNCEHKNNEVYSTKYHAPTCSSYGYDQVNFCHDCSFYYIPDEHVIPKTDHDYDVKHAHVGDDVLKISVCKNCDDTKTEDITDEAWELVSTSDTCTLGGDLVYKCVWDDCDETRTVLGDGHDYVLHFETIVKPTCEKDGKLTVTCNDCAYKADVIIYKLNKNDGKCNWVETKKVDATCTEDGYINYECSECHATKTEELKALGHDGEVLGVNAEKHCVNDMKCKRCGVEYTEHNEAYVKTDRVEPTCDKYGYEFKVCLVCGKDVDGYNVTFLIDKLPHTPSEPKVKAPTCTDAGYNYIECTVCHTILEKAPLEDTEATGHAEGIWDYLTAADYPTCVTAGKKTFICPTCRTPLLDKDGNVQTQVIAPDTEGGHDLIGDPAKGEGSKITTAPTCTLWGEISVWCTLCGLRDDHVNNLDIPAGWDNWYDGFIFNGTAEEIAKAVKDGDAVEVAEGVYIHAQFDIRPTGHLYDWANAQVLQEMDCKNDGIAKATCTVCGAEETVVTEKSNPFAHSMDPSNAILIPNHEDNRPATCTTPAYLMYNCKTCGRDFAEPSGDALGHDFVEIDPGYAVPDCVTDGKLATVQCSVCGEYKYDADKNVVLDGSAIKAPGHTKVEVEASAPTCKDAGWNMDGWYCSVCGAKSDAALVKLPALGHDISYKKFEVTCDKDGFIFYGCTRCGLETLEASFIDNFVYATGHKWETGVVVAPTCDAQGYTMNVCTVCGATEKYDFKDALGHVNAAGVKIPEKCHAEFDHDFDTVCVTCGKDIDVHAGNYFITHQPGSCIWEYEYDLYLCTVCGYQKAENIDKDPYPKHFPDAGKVIVAPTAGKTGIIEYTCTNPNCGYKWTEEIEALSGLVFDTEVSAYNINTDTFTNKAVNSGYIAVTITMSGTDIELWGAEMSVAFNNEVLVFDAEKTEAYNAENVLKSYFNADGAIVNIAASYTENAKENYTLNGVVTYATLFFKVNADKYNLDLNFAIVEDSDIIVDKDGDELTATCNNADAIHVYELGNVLVDEKGYPTDALRNIKDANAIMDMLAAPGDDTDELADIDKDGIVTVKDFQLLMLIIVDQKNYVSYIE